MYIIITESCFIMKPNRRTIVEDRCKKAGRTENMEDKLILYEDRDIIVCHKKAGIPVQSARIGQKDMVSILNNYLAEKRREAKTDTGRRDVLEPVKVVHRLDQPVEGVIVFAKTKKAAAGLGRQIVEGSMKKIYHAVCCVTEKASSQEWYEKIENLMPDEMSDRISSERRQSRELSGRTYQLVDYLVRDGRTNTSCVTDKGKKDAKRAELSYQILNAAEIHKKKYLLAEIELKTGRHHQIRVQMAHAGLPLYGDIKYNDGCCGFGRKNPGLALCAVSLTFCHPVSGKQMTFETRPEAEIFNIFSEK